MQDAQGAFEEVRDPVAGLLFCKRGVVQSLGDFGRAIRGIELEHFS